MRHGSNVPGPLEARRRHSKRRLGTAVAATAHSLPPPDPSLLFGLGYGGQTRFPLEKSWNWTPPNINGKQPERDQENVSSTDSPFPLRFIPPKSKNWEEYLGEPEALPLDTENMGIGAVETSKTAFKALIEYKGQLKFVQKIDLEDVVSFLYTSANDPGAWNTLYLVEWLAQKDITDDCRLLVLDLVQGKVQSGTLEHEEVPLILASLLPHIKQENATSLVSVLDNLSSKYDMTAICVEVTRLILIPSKSKRPTDINDCLPEMLLWLEVLRGCERLKDWHHLNLTWRGIYDILAVRFQRVAPIAKHFLQLKNLEIAHILLRHWVPQIISQTGEPQPNMKSTVTDRTNEKAIHFHGSFDSNTISIETLVEEFQALHSNGLYSPGKRNTLVELLAFLQKHHIPYTQLSDNIFSIMMESPRAAKTYQIFKEIQRSPSLGIETELAARLVRHFLAIDHLVFAVRVFETSPSLSLRRCFDLPIKLAKHGTIPSARIFRMILRQPATDVLPPSQRPASTPILTLTSEQIDLAHLVAFELAHSPHIRPRVAYRRVWECYRFLRDREAPIGSILSRAFVFAGVIRPLMNGKRLSTEMFKYIISIVSAVEGPEVGHALDVAVWRIWKSHQLPEFLGRRSRTPRGVETVLETPMVEVDSAMWRLKNWHRPKLGEKTVWQTKEGVRLTYQSPSRGAKAVLTPKI